jgi:hypothetical protein
MIPIIDSVLDIGGKLIDKLIPDPVEKMKAQAALLQMQQNGELKELETRMSAIIAEANSKDPWTSRARPSFMYVIYVCILAGIPMGVLHAFYPAIAVGVAEGFKAWLQAIPDTLYTLFGVGYVGYSAARTVDKRRAK